MNSWIFPYMKKYRWRIALSALYALLGVASGAMLLFVSGYLISKSSLQPVNIMVVYIPIVSVRAFSIGQAVFPYLEKLVSHDIVLRILAKYRQRLYDILEPQAMFLQSRYRTGDILTLLSDDIERLQDLFIKTMLPAVAGVVIYGAFALVVGFFSFPFMLLMLAVLGVLVFLMPLLSYYLMVRHHVKIKKARANLYEKSTDAMFGQLDWLVSGRVDHMLQAISKDNKKLMGHIDKVNRWQVYRDFLLQLTLGVAVILMMLWSNSEVNANVFSPTVIAAFTLMMFAVSDALKPLSKAAEEVSIYDESLKRMNQLSQADIKEVAFPAWKVKKEASLHVDNVFYRYPASSEQIIDGMSFSIEQGEKVAILGRSGAGKSTLLKLISGIIEPDKGNIFLGESKVNREVLGRAISVLNQKPHLFHTTVANNVRIGNNHATDEAIKEALEQAEIGDLIDSLPEGMHTQMDEMGKRFSGG
ncbi:MAG TPA: thiol reductant ABC exporter subunit CydC, partial [Pseudogracilibacillus sp.]|nr:thiol reductant ABC exporter subunit CydC [Pseudogracilibacillus sp.]